MNANIAMQQSDDEIDLTAIIQILWEKKLSILLVACLFTVLAGIYAFTATEKWTSKAIVDEPKLIDFKEYLALQNQYATNVEGKQVKGDALGKQLYKRFILTLNSNDVKYDFLKQYEPVQKELKEMGESEQEAFLNKFITQQLTINYPNVKLDPNAVGLNVNYTDATPKQAQSTLTAYIDYVNRIVVEQDSDSWLVQLDNRKTELEVQAKIIAQNTESERKVYIANLSKALQTAQAAGITDYELNKYRGSSSLGTGGILNGDLIIPLSTSKVDDNPYLYLLGSKYLNSQLHAVENAPLVYPLEYYTIEDRLKTLAPLTNQMHHYDVQAHAYSYLSSPNYPIKKDAPKRGVILVIGFIIGVILGSGFALLNKFVLFAETGKTS